MYEVKWVSKINEEAYLEAFLEVFVLLQESSIVYDHLSVGNFQFHNFVVHPFRRLDGPDRFLQVNIERPELERFEEANLRAEVLMRTVRKVIWTWSRKPATHMVMVVNFSNFRNCCCPLHDSDGFVVISGRQDAWANHFKAQIETERRTLVEFPSQPIHTRSPQDHLRI